MEKLVKTLPNFRVDEETKDIISEMARKKRRTQTQFLQILMESIAKDYKNNGTWYYEKYF